MTPPPPPFQQKFNQYFAYLNDYLQNIYRNKQIHVQENRREFSLDTLWNDVFFGIYNDGDSAIEVSMKIGKHNIFDSVTIEPHSFSSVTNNYPLLLKYLKFQTCDVSINVISDNRMKSDVTNCFSAHAENYSNIVSDLDIRLAYGSLNDYPFVPDHTIFEIVFIFNYGALQTASMMGKLHDELTQNAVERELDEGNETYFSTMNEEMVEYRDLTNVEKYAKIIHFMGKIE